MDKKKLSEFAERAGLGYKRPDGQYWIDAGFVDIHLERFAALVRQDEAQACAKHYLKIMRDAASEARFKEREACLKILSDYGQSEALIECADLIRQRGRNEH